MCLPLCLNLELHAQQVKKVEAAAVLRWSHTATVLLGGGGGGVAYARGFGFHSDDSSNWGY